MFYSMMLFSGTKTNGEFETVRAELMVLLPFPLQGPGVRFLLV